MYKYVDCKSFRHLPQMLNVCTQVLAHTRVYFYDEIISPRTILVHWINLKMTYKSYWYIYSICCIYNAELPSFHKQHTEASHLEVVVSYNETNEISPPFLFCTKNVARNYFFFVWEQVYIFSDVHAYFIEKKIPTPFCILSTISDNFR